MASDLFLVVEDKGTLEFFPLEEGARCFRIETFSDDMDGIFPRISDYTRFANSIDNEGVIAYLRRILGRTKTSDIEYCTVKRESIHDHEATLMFKEPVETIIEEIEIISTETTVQFKKKIKAIEGFFTYRWYWSQNARQDKIANICELFFVCEKFEFDD
jgi:hypothetical protein